MHLFVYSCHTWSSLSVQLANICFAGAVMPNCSWVSILIPLIWFSCGFLMVHSDIADICFATAQCLYSTGCLL